MHLVIRYTIRVQSRHVGIHLQLIGQFEIKLEGVGLVGIHQLQLEQVLSQRQHFSLQYPFVFSGGGE